MSSRKLVPRAQGRENGLGGKCGAHFMDKWARSWLFNMLSAVCILVSAFREPQRTQAGRPIFSFLLGLLTTQEKGFQTREACNFNTFNCLWPFRSPICFLSSKHTKIMATADVLVKGPQRPGWFGFSWVIWPASFREMRICFLHFGCVVAGFQEQLMCGVGWRHSMTGSARTS